MRARSGVARITLVTRRWIVRASGADPAGLRLSRLTHVLGSFIDESLKWQYTDMLFRASLDGQDVFIYMLVEHESSDEHLLALRMARLVERIWEQHQRDRPGSQKLPRVVPLVFHHDHVTRNSLVEQLPDLLDLDHLARKTYWATVEMLAAGRPSEACLEALTSMCGTLPNTCARKSRQPPSPSSRYGRLAS